VHLLTAWLSMQADTGAQVIQIFDSWASELMPQDFDVFAGPYIKKVINSFRYEDVRLCVTRPARHWPNSCFVVL
jgi:uroporphyrinogen-III decarboxylase